MAIGSTGAPSRYVRSFDPPLINDHTIPGTGEVMGGTGEFAGARGVAREIDIIHEIDLLTGMHELEVIVQVALLPRGGKG